MTAERISLAVLCAETRGFTRMSDILEPPVVVARTREFNDLVSTAVQHQRGAICSCLNHHVTAIFGGENHAPRAVRAAEDIRRDFGALAEAWERDHRIRAAVAMGLHAGDAVTDKSDAAAAPVVIGDTVTVAEILLRRSRAGEFIMSKAMMGELDEARFDIEVIELPTLSIPHRESLRIYGAVLDDRRLDFT